MKWRKVQSLPFLCPSLCSPFRYPWDQRMTLVAFSKDVVYLVSPTLANRTLPSLVRRSEPSYLIITKLGEVILLCTLKGDVMCKAPQQETPVL